MKYYKSKLMIVSFMTYMIMAGLLTQVGIIIGPMSKYLDISITDAASIFSYLTGGTLVGTFISMAAYSKYQIKNVFRLNYLVFLFVLLLLMFIDFRSSTIISIYLFVLGICCGVGLSGGAVMISKIFNEEKRASAFIATDCAFSAAGFIFPSIATILIAKNIGWTSGYASVGLIAVFVLVSTFIFKYPEESHDNSTAQATVSSMSLKAIINVRVILIGFALGLYLLAQTTFLTWAPSYLQEIFKMKPEESGLAVANYWGPSVFGLIAAAILVNKVSTRYLLVIILFIAVFITFFLNITTSPKLFLVVTMFFGFFTSCIYKLGISIGSQQVKDSPAILVTFLLTCGGVGSTTAPALSAFFVGSFGVNSSMILTTVILLLVCILFMACLILEKITNIKQVSDRR